MAFPNSPSIGQAANGYTWDGEKWITPVVAHPSDATKLDVAARQTTTGGFRFTTYNAGTVSSGTFTPDAYNGNYQVYTNAGAHTLATPAPDCAMDIMVINGTGAGAITFSGFAGGTTGDALTTTVGHRFIISIRRIAGYSAYLVKALQ